MTTLTQELKQKAIDVGFVSAGVSNPDMLRDLPHGRIHSTYNLCSPEEHLPGVRSVLLMALHPWDKAFDLQVDSTNLQELGMRSNQGQAESYQLYYEVMKSKAWTIAYYLRKRGFESLYSLDIPLKTSAVRCGLGYQGKNTLLITPGYGPRVRLISVLTTAELDTDEPYNEDLCRNCEKCYCLPD